METKHSNSQIVKHKISWKEFEEDIKCLVDLIRPKRKKYSWIYPIPKNGLYVAELLANSLFTPLLLDFNNPLILNGDNILIVDDLIDSGETLSKYKNYDKAVLYVKNNNEDKVNYFVRKSQNWLQFPWEKEEDIEDTIIRQLEYIGEDPKREGLESTPKRVIKSWDKLFSGYKQDPVELFKTFKEGTCGEMVILKDIEFYSTCEHHMLPFFGKCHIGYLPNKGVIGVSKLARLVELYARRLQIQEKLTTQIADDINLYLQAKGVIVVIEAQHFCMTSRGVEKQNSKMITSAIRGEFIINSVAREEFLKLIKE